jgi:hypothetical protein
MPAHLKTERPMWWRIFLGIVAGIIAAGVIAFGFESLGHMIYPPPAGLDLTNPEHLKAMMESVPLGSKIIVVVAWAAASFMGGLIAAWIGRSMLAAIGVGLVLVGFGVWTMVMIPHPVWMTIAGVIALLVPACLGGWVATRRNGIVMRE